MAHDEGSRAGFVRGLSLLGAVALIVGNMVGTSIYTLPASLAKEVGPLGLFAWGLTAAGYLFVAIVYARLGTRFPRTGGPYVYAREAFGDFTGFQTVWMYWLSATIGNAAIAQAVVAYVAGFSSALDHSPTGQFLLAQAMLWILCGVNVLGVKHGARLQIVILFVNLIPLSLIALLLLGSFDSRNLVPLAPHGWSALPYGMTLVVWAYSGIESATVPAEEVDAPERTIRRGTMIGYVVATGVLLLTALAVAGAVPNDVVAAESARPIAAAAEMRIGPWAGWAIAVAAIVAGLGTLNGWVLMAGRIPVSAASDGLFFPRLARLHPRFGTPATSLVVGSVVASAMLFLVLGRSLLDAFNTIVQLALLTTLLPHLAACVADFALYRRDRARGVATAGRGIAATSLIATAFVLLTIAGLDPWIWAFGVGVFVAGIPLYAWLRARPRG